MPSLPLHRAPQAPRSPRPRRGDRRLKWWRLTPLGLGVWFCLAGPVWAQPEATDSGMGDGERSVVVPLECRLREGAWQPCHMQIEEVGGHWWLLIGDQRLEFRHDGRGSVTMQEHPTGRWQPVSSRWQEDTSLCWDGVCAKGDIPLD